LLAGALLASTTVAAAGIINPGAVQAARERQVEHQAQRAVERREQRAQPAREASPPRAENRGNAAPPPRRNDGAAANRPSPPQGNANRPNPPPQNASRDNAGRYDGPRFARDNARDTATRNGRGNNAGNSARGNDRPAVRLPQQGVWQNLNDRGSGYRPAPPRNNYRPVPPRRHVPVLPTGYARYHWNGRPYYYSSGHWYRPWGSQFAIVAAPIGLFVSYLPGYHTSFWYGSNRYFFADDTYYLYEPARRGYVVTRSPYGDAAVEEEATFDDDELYVYPARGQSEQQQADDRYECHSWAVGETGYDPVLGNYVPDLRADYLRAMSACLTGRGYSVR
jgi:hypothetical protein